MKDVVKKNIVAIMCLFCACLYLILCNSACINVEYFLEVGDASRKEDFKPHFK